MPELGVVDDVKVLSDDGIGRLCSVYGACVVELNPLVEVPLRYWGSAGHAPLTGEVGDCCDAAYKLDR